MNNLKLKSIIASFTIIFMLTYSTLADASIIKAGMWIKDQLVAYSVSKTIDKALGRQKINELNQLKAQLERQSRTSTASMSNVKVQLDAINTELKILRAMVYSQPSNALIKYYQNELNDKLAIIDTVLIDHELRISAIENKLNMDRPEIKTGKINITSDTEKNLYHYASLTNRANFDVNFQYRWDDDKNWQTIQLKPNYCQRLGSKRDQKIWIKFDKKLTQAIETQTYTLKRKLTSKSTKCGGKKYKFYINGGELDVVGV